MRARSPAAVGALEVLVDQHRQIATLFELLGGAREMARRQQLFDALADALAVHAAIEEGHFYPAVRAPRTDGILLAALADHLGLKRAVAEMLGSSVADETFDAKLSVLRERFEQHVREEETDLLPHARDLLAAPVLEAIARDMLTEQDDLIRRGEPRWSLPRATQPPPDLVSFR
jgi:hemerythrin-like domain-containing protein